ncbi:hypothetical protein [Flavobacterium sp. HJSW_4]|uniref:hypothetical protein n=1 Tax=Flavobacterium sp. HJSW_4 TaxID=3344660 RepID=UPI0035F2FF74
MEHKLNDISFTTTSYVYSRIQVLTWIANGTSLLNILEKDACELLALIVSETEANKPIVINFKGITDIDDHAMDSIFLKLNDNKKQLVIINGHHLLGKIDKLKKDSKAIINSNSENETITIGKASQVDFIEVFKEREIYIEKFIKSTISNSFKKFPREIRLCSTPIIANGEFNSSEIISNPNKFIWIVFFLSDKLSKILNESRLENVKLLSASLRGAPFAAMLGLIHNIKFETIDHLGPRHKIFDINFVKQKEKGINYIYIGDFVFGGTEIKIAKTYTEMKGSKLCHALVIGSLFDKDTFTHEFDLTYLTGLKDITGGEAQFKLFN